ncbi:hypothetical protein HYPSUDRAFT_49568 [Hypholoma sublateritium FD-334 SS-4]|uniref:Heterokaryon incompatibility domain-containing protein n=1 Tax=Hypholoma sublateritium (strain FD-334 SS-4) TaxID=945553 RepID=A0A0D2LSQ3_HYPSF|nr:hypothetical protein HYPSUDRAFT_49568 [Hypholoma sublateritium FD-334 SS-4]
MSGTDTKTRIQVNNSVFEQADDPGVGRTLITALANFVVPLIQGYTIAPGIGIGPSYTLATSIAEDPSASADGAVRTGSGLTIEGQDLLVALERFAASLVHSQNGQRTENASPGNLNQLGSPATNNGDVDTLEMDSSVQPVAVRDGYKRDYGGLGFIVTEADTKRQRLIKRNIERARDVVFNNMPIRLLMFDQDGTGITLVERSEVMACISSEIISRADLSFPYRDWKLEKYAILSHTWLPKGEVTYSEWRNHTAPLDTQSPGYDKLEKFCKVAAKHGLRLAWMDTVCINKDSSAELDESIRSMFKWYEGAEVCIAYLAETRSLDDMAKDKWFTRGWTLQELLAPRCIKFFSKSWTALSRSPADHSDKLRGPLVSKICDATGLDKNELSGSPRLLHSVPIWRKMQWAANRKVTREEDTAYSLMGIFNVSMPTGYGEGAERAFLRLVKEILSSKLTSVSKLEIVNWSSTFDHGLANLGLYSDISSSALIPRGPHAYMHSSSNRRVHFRPASAPITLSCMGLCVPVLLMPSSLVRERPDNKFSPKGDYSATFHSSEEKSRNCIYKVLDGDLFSANSTRDGIYIFAVLNIADEAGNVLLPENGHCLAIKLFPYKPLDGWEIPEGLQFERGRRHFTFDIAYHNNSSFQISKDKLNRHGMTLRTMHL